MQKDKCTTPQGIEEQVRSLIESFSNENKELFEKYIQLPNRADIHPEVMKLVFRYGEKFSQVSDQVESVRQKLKMNYDDLREEILRQLENNPQIAIIK